MRRRKNLEILIILRQFFQFQRFIIVRLGSQEKKKKKTHIKNTYVSHKFWLTLFDLTFWIPKSEAIQSPALPDSALWIWLNTAEPQLFPFSGFFAHLYNPRNRVSIYFSSLFTMYVHRKEIHQHPQFKTSFVSKSLTNLSLQWNLSSVFWLHLLLLLSILTGYLRAP